MTDTLGLVQLDQLHGPRWMVDQIRCVNFLPGERKKKNYFTDFGPEGPRTMIP